MNKFHCFNLSILECPKKLSLLVSPCFLVFDRIVKENPSNRTIKVTFRCFFVYVFKTFESTLKSGWKLHVIVYLSVVFLTALIHVWNIYFFPFSLNLSASSSFVLQVDRPIPLSLFLLLLTKFCFVTPFFNSHLKLVFSLLEIEFDLPR